MNEAKKYDYFICYCGRDLNIKEGVGCGPNWEFALALFDYLEGLGKNVYFAPMVGQGDTFRNEAFLQQLINEFKTFIVLLSPSFFKDFYPEWEFRQINRSPIQMEMKAAIDRVQTYGGSEKYLQYIHLPGFEWCNLYHFCIKECLGLSEEDVAKCVDISAYNNVTKIATDAKGAAKEFLKNNLGIDVDRNNEIIAYRREVECCFHSMMEHIGRDDYFEIDDDSAALLKKLGIGTENRRRSSIWPTFFTEGVSHGKERREVSTCALCFGVLQILHWCDIDRMDRKARSKDLREYYQSTDAYFEEICRDALIQIILLRMNGQRTEERWPIAKNFEIGKWDSGEAEDNGLNQTTLSTATLLKSGFLRKTSAYWSGPNDEELAERYSFLSRSVAWVLKQKKSETDESGCDFCFWGANGVKDSTFLTAISLDLLLKFTEDEYAKQHKGEAFCDAIRTIPKIVAYFEIASEGAGVVSALNGPESFSHTAKVMNTLCAFCAERERLLLKEFDIDVDTLVLQAKKIIKKCFEYLSKELDSETKIYEKKKSRHGYDFFIRYEPDHEIEYYELNGELLAVTAMTKLLDDAAWHSDIKVENKDVIFTKLIEFFEGYRKGDGRVKHYFDWTASESVLIRGRRTCQDEQYPIYALYYYRMALVELLNLLEKNDASFDELTQNELLGQTEESQ